MMVTSLFLAGRQSKPVGGLVLHEEMSFYGIYYYGQAEAASLSPRLSFLHSWSGNYTIMKRLNECGIVACLVASTVVPSSRILALVSRRECGMSAIRKLSIRRLGTPLAYRNTCTYLHSILYSSHWDIVISSCSKRLSVRQT